MQRSASGVTITAGDDALAPTIERWARALEAKGASLRDGETLLLDGWPFTVRGDRLLTLDLETKSDEPSRWVEQVDVVARIIASQLEVFEAYGLDGAFSPPLHIATIAVCPGHRREGTFMLARTAPEWPTSSGWVMQCGHLGCIHALRDDRRHVPNSEWKEISIVDFVVARQSLARYLALPVGSVAANNSGRGPIVGKRYAHADVPVETNVAAFDLPSAYCLPYERRTPTRGALDLDLHEARGLLLLTDAFDVLCDRYGVDAESARATLARYRTPEMQLARIHAAFPDLDALAIAAAVEILRSEGASRVRIHQDVGRKLRELTGRPFAELQKLAEKIDAERELVERSSRD